MGKGMHRTPRGEAEFLPRWGWLLSALFPFPSPSPRSCPKQVLVSGTAFPSCTKAALCRRAPDVPHPTKTPAPGTCSPGAPAGLAGRELPPAASGPRNIELFIPALIMALPQDHRGVPCPVGPGLPPRGHRLGTGWTPPCHGAGEPRSCTNPAGGRALVPGDNDGTMGDTLPSGG